MKKTLTAICATFLLAAPIQIASAATNTTIALVLVQEDNGIEHPIYYLNHNLKDT